MKQTNGVINYAKINKTRDKTNKSCPNNKCHKKKSHKHSNLNPFKNPQCPLQTLY